MNYKTQLKGWAMEMVLKYYALVPSALQSLEQLKKDTDVLVDYSYNARKDIEDHIKELFELIRAVPIDEDDYIEFLQGSLEQMQAERAKFKPQANGADKEAIQ